MDPMKNRWYMDRLPQRDEGALTADRLYLEAISEVGTLAPGEEESLIRQAAGGDAAAKERLKETNWLLVYRIVTETYEGRCGLSKLDLLQEGNDALTNAVDTFDYSFGTGFTAYAEKQICKGIERAISRACTDRPVPDKAFLKDVLERIRTKQKEV